MIPAGWSRAGAAAALVVAMAAAHVPVHAAAPGPFLLHRVVQGDTLASIGARYLRVPGQWRELQALNQIGDPTRLEAGRLIRVPRRLLRPAGMATAQVEFAQGRTTHQIPADSASALQTGDAVSEGARLQVPRDGYLRLRLADGSVVRVLADSDVELRRLRAKRPGMPSQSVIGMHKGRVEADVAPQPRSRMFEVQAPGAVASVRGTRFDVAVGSDARVSTAVTEGVVRLQPRGGRGRPAAADVTAGQGAVIDGRGRMSPPHALPAAPDLSQLPSEFGDAGPMTLQLAPLSRSGGYQVRIARGDALREVVRNGVFQTARVQFDALEDGDYTLGVRLLDADGLAGAESHRTLRVRTRPVVRTGTGGALVSSDGAPIGRR